VRSDVSYVGHPDPIRRIDFKLTIQRVVSNDSRLAAIATRATLG